MPTLDWIPRLATGIKNAHTETKQHINSITRDDDAINSDSQNLTKCENYLWSHKIQSPTCFQMQKIKQQNIMIFQTNWHGPLLCIHRAGTTNQPCAFSEKQARSEQLTQTLLSILGCQRGRFPFTYLGLLLSTRINPKQLIYCLYKE